jgi:type III secretory pathway component EscV
MVVSAALVVEVVADRKKDILTELENSTYVHSLSTGRQHYLHFAFLDQFPIYTNLSITILTFIIFQKKTSKKSEALEDVHDVRWRE